MWGSKREQKPESEELVDSSAKTFDFTKNIPPPPGKQPHVTATQHQQMAQQQFAAPQKSMIPSHMDDNEKIIIQSKRGGQRKNVEQIDRGEMSIFAEKMASLVGPSYVIAFGCGATYGLT